MKTTTEFGLVSNENKELRILKLKRDFQEQKVITIKSAQKATGLTRPTIIKYAKEGNIPLWDEKRKESIVKITASNKPKWMD